MSSLNKEAVPSVLISKIKDYFDYVWANSKGISYEEILEDLPPCLNADILQARYSEAIRNSIIFKDVNDMVDTALTNSILTVLEYRVYMNGDFIIIGGSSSMNTYILMEGEAVIMGLNEEFIAYIKSGGHYSNDLDPDDEDTFEYKRPLHMVSKGISIVGVLNVEKLNSLFTAYPNFKARLRDLNKNFTEYVKKYCVKYLQAKNLEYSRINIVKFIADHYSYSTSVVYDSVRKKSKAIDLNAKEIKSRDIILKQKEGVAPFQTLRRQPVHDGRNSIDFVNVNIFKETDEHAGCYSKLYFDKNSNVRRVIDFLNLINLLYIAF